MASTSRVDEAADSSRVNGAADSSRVDETTDWSRVSEVTDTSSLAATSEDVPKEFLAFKEHLKSVETLIDTYNKKIFDNTLRQEDLDVMKRQLKCLSDLEQAVTAKKMKSSYVPYKVLALKMVQESYRICDWFINKQFGEMDNIFNINTFFDRIFEACAGKENPFEHINYLFEGVLKNDKNFNLNFYGNIKPNSTYEIPSKQTKKKFKRSQNHPLEDQIVPVEVENEMSDNELQITMTRIKNCLAQAVANNNGEPVPFFKFAIDPFSLSQSVENLYHLAVLFKDGLVNITLNPGLENDDKFTTITVVKKKHNKNNYKPQEDENYSMCTLLTINHDLWKHYIEKYNITEQMITHVE